MGSLALTLNQINKGFQWHHIDSAETLECLHGKVQVNKMSVSNIWSCLMLYQVKLINSQRSKSKNTCPTLLQRAQRCTTIILIPTHLPNGCSWLSAWALLQVWDILMLPCSPCLHLPHPGITGLQHHARLLSKNIWCCCHSTRRHRDLKSR